MTGETQIDPQPGGRAAAPGELGLLQRFLNTRWNLHDGSHAEVFTSAQSLRDWLASQDLVAPGARIAKADVARAVAVREGLRALAFANNDHELDTAAVDAMREASRGAATGIDIDVDGPHFLAGPAAGLDGALGALYGITARAMLDGSWKKLKACPGRHCGWVFYDQSRNQSARWCSMKVCGDREKARAYYGRKTRARS